MFEICFFSHAFLPQPIELLFISSSIDIEYCSKDSNKIPFFSWNPIEKENLAFWLPEQCHGNLKNKHLKKGSTKGAKKKMIDPFYKKDGYDVKAPAVFNIKNIGKTLVIRTQRTKIGSDGLNGHVFEVSLEVSLAGLQNDETGFRKFNLITEDFRAQTA